MEIKQYIQENEERFLNELFSLIRIPSISALPAHKDDMLACAERWRQLLLEAGADEAMVMPSERHPLVYALTVSPAPKNCAAITANPLVSPCKKPITRVFTELVEPTAASELSPNTYPIILVSTRL